MLLIYGECRRNSWNRNADPENCFIINQNIEINVLAYVNVNATDSLREIAQELDTSRETVRRILKKHNYRSFKYNLHQHLYDTDEARRIQYCTWLLNKNNDDNNFVKSILFTDESRFCNNAMFNRQNSRYWSQNNRRLVRPGRFQ